MKAPWALVVLVVAAFSAGTAGSAAAQSNGSSGGAAQTTRTTLPNDFCIELLGRSIVYNFSYQRMLNPYLGLEASFAGLGAGSTSDGGSGGLLFGSLGARAYIVKKNASPFVTGGVVLLNVSTDSGPFSDNSSASYGYSGVGFEFRAPSGFLFRGTAYGLISGSDFFVWPGLTIGYAF